MGPRGRVQSRPIRALAVGASRRTQGPAARDVNVAPRVRSRIPREVAPIARHGGGAFSGKDSTKVDRSAAYMARYVAKNIVAAGLADELEIQLAYAIGVAEPVSVFVNSFGTATVAEDMILKVIKDEFDLTPTGIINALSLRDPIFSQTSAYGHFGRNDISLPWEACDRVTAIKERLNLFVGA